MKKLILLVAIIFLIGCSSPQERKDIIEMMGFEVIYQNDTKNCGEHDFFIAKNEKGYFLIKLDRFGDIYSVKRLNIN